MGVEVWARRVNVSACDLERTVEQARRLVLPYWVPLSSPLITDEATVRVQLRGGRAWHHSDDSSKKSGLATIEYVIGAAVVLGTLVAGVSAWNNGLVTRLQSLVSQLSGVR